MYIFRFLLLGTGVGLFRFHPSSCIYKPTNSLDCCLLKHENNQLLFLGEENDCDGESSPPASFDES